MDIFIFLESCGKMLQRFKKIMEKFWGKEPFWVGNTALLTKKKSETLLEQNNLLLDVNILDDKSYIPSG